MKRKVICYQLEFGKWLCRRFGWMLLAFTLMTTGAFSWNVSNHSGSLGRSESLSILNVSLTRAHLCMYPAGFYYSNSLWEWDHRKVEPIKKSQLRLTSQTGSGAYARWPANSGSGSMCTCLLKYSMTKCMPRRYSPQVKIIYVRAWRVKKGEGVCSKWAH